MLGSYSIRTDLALEATERFTEENVEVRGVEVQEDYNEEKDIRTTVVKSPQKTVHVQWVVPREIILPLKHLDFLSMTRTITERFHRKSCVIFKNL